MVNYYEPAEDHNALAARILNLLEHRPPQSELQHIKETLAQEYDPKKIAALYFDLFERLVRR
jgi:glycosyltransferase involved in cell wall biosynthesis